MSETRPRVSFGLPVWNGEQTIRRCIDSILAQQFRDFELVVSDNASTDATPEILAEYAARDPRVRVHRNPENVGQIENVNRVFHLSRGEYFRWIGADDWLEPEYATLCVEALDAHPEAIVATTYFRIYDEHDRLRYEEFEGERLESPDPARRFARMLWFFHAGDTAYDPVYSLMRRSALERTPLIRRMAFADWMLAAELALMGPFTHVSKCLANRHKSYTELADRPATMRRYDPQAYARLPASSWRLYRVLHSIAKAADVDAQVRRRSYEAALRFLVRDASWRARRHIGRFRRERLRLTRATLGLPSRDRSS